ncbi:Alpha/Beta hydrolase protein [Exophiala viscosa]|uniref:Alpha/Beta hydrolase protein n=1 Tax=Exophiala viscosa TaxID=2486360 RepID=UPI00219EE62F|nr:Alpha/Beta hydrolase protein [Exophiala viscosa]
MRSAMSFAAMALAAGAIAAPTSTIAKRQLSFVDIPTGYLQGFKNPTVQSSAGGQAICISGMVDVTASANNIQIKLPDPTNQTEVSERIAEFLQVNSTLGQQALGGPNPVNGTFGIYSQLCFPAATGTINATTIEFLIHGAGLDRTYWNTAPGYSYVDYAAQQGYTTFFYDRLGWGLSDHPDGTQIVQLPLQVEIAHELIQLLRTGGIANQTFEYVVGVGHSFGSSQTNRLTALHPDDLDAAVLTGFSTDNSGMAAGFAGFGLSIASQINPLRFSDRSNSYLTGPTIEGTQPFFFRWPGFDVAVLDIAEETKAGITWGEFFVNGQSVASNFTGPVDVVNGESDLPNCHGNCLIPSNKLTTVKDAYYPAASYFSWYIGPDAGHALNLHYAAPGAYEHIHNFLRTHGL